MPTLTELFTGDKFAALADDVASFARTTISNQTGVSGMAVKSGLAAAEKAKPNIIESAVGHFLPDMLNVLQPYWETKPAESSLGTILDANQEKVAEELMVAADAKAQEANNSALIKLYQSLRGKGAKVIAPNLKDLGDIVEKHAGM